MPTTPAGDASLAEAARLAGRQPVGSHHLLLAALADPDSAAAKTLTALGVNLDQAREALRNADVAGTSDEQLEERGRRHMVIRVTSESLTIEATDPAIVALARAAIQALGGQAQEAGIIRGDQPGSAAWARCGWPCGTAWKTSASTRPAARVTPATRKAARRRAGPRRKPGGPGKGAAALGVPVRPSAAAPAFAASPAGTGSGPGRGRPPLPRARGRTRRQVRVDVHRARRAAAGGPPWGTDSGSRYPARARAELGSLGRAPCGPVPWWAARAAEMAWSAAHWERLARVTASIAARRARRRWTAMRCGITSACSAISCALPSGPASAADRAFSRATSCEPSSAWMATTRKFAMRTHDRQGQRDDQGGGPCRCGPGRRAPPRASG